MAQHYIIALTLFLVTVSYSQILGIDPRYSGFSAIARNSFGPEGFTQADTDELDYNTLFEVPSADVLEKLIALSESNSAENQSKKKKKRKPLKTNDSGTSRPPITVEDFFESSGQYGIEDYDSTARLVNECKDPLVCDENAICTDLTYGYSCACKSGFSGDGFLCTEGILRSFSHHILLKFLINFFSVDECEKAIHDCHRNADCKNTVGSYECYCKKGFIGNGKYCNDVDECKQKRVCPYNSKCTNTIGSFKCECKDGFQSNGIEKGSLFNDIIIITFIDNIL